MAKCLRWTYYYVAVSYFVFVFFVVVVVGILYFIFYSKYVCATQIWKNDVQIALSVVQSPLPPLIGAIA